MCCNNNRLVFGIGTFSTCGCSSCNSGANADFVSELMPDYRRSGRSGNCGCGCGCGCNNNDN